MTAAAMILQAVMQQNNALRARIAGLAGPKDLEEVLQPYFKAALDLVRKTAG
jgi:hypothetical protein